jgi:hypothetical protein
MSETARQLLYLASLSEWLRYAPKRPPCRLSNFLRDNGGVRDWRGEITNLTGGKRYRGFGLVCHHGLKIDDAALLAWENGYLSNAIERPTISDFLDALREDLTGNPVYSVNDWERLEQFERAEAARIELDALGLLADTPAKQKRVELALTQAAEGLSQ